MVCEIRFCQVVRYKTLRYFVVFVITLALFANIFVRHHGSQTMMDISNVIECR